MTDDSRSDELATASGAYVLHALDPAERARFERLLGSSEEVRAEVVELSDTAVELGLAVTPQQPAASLRAAILARVAETAQLPAEPATDAGLAPSAEVLPPSPQAAVRWFQRPAVMITSAAAAVVLLIGCGVAIDRTSTTSQALQLAEIAAASDFERASITLDGGGNATLMWSGELGRSVLVASGMSSAPAGHTYELWYLRDGEAIPAGTFDSRDEIVCVVLDGQMHAGDAVGVTVEPMGGSPVPTTEPVMVIGGA